jgi:hypothetical protein
MRDIRLLPDHGGRQVLWESRAPVNDPTPEQLGLSPELGQALDAWYDFWEEHGDAFSGWDSRANEHQFRHEGERLRQAVQTELGDDFRVVF